MRSRRIEIALYALLCIACAPSCGGDSSSASGVTPPLTVPTAPSGTLSLSQAKALADGHGRTYQTLSQLGPEMVDVHGGYFPVQLVAGDTSFPDLRICKSYTVDSGSKDDADHDYIPDDLAVTYSCASSTDGDLAGSVTTHDADPSDFYGGYAIDVRELRFEQTPSVHVTMDVNAAMRSTKNPDGTYTSKALVEGSSSLDNSTAFQGLYIDARFDTVPNTMGLPSGAGKMISFSGFLKLRQSADRVDYVVSVTGADLVYDATACTSQSGGTNNKYQSGTLTFLDGSGHTLVITFASCFATATYDGAPL